MKKMFTHCKPGHMYMVDFEDETGYRGTYRAVYDPENAEIYDPEGTVFRIYDKNFPEDTESTEDWYITHAEPITQKGTQ